MARTLWIDWGQPVEYVRDLRRAIADARAGAALPPDMRRLLSLLGDSYGVYMFLEARGVERRREAEMENWRRSEGLAPFPGARNLIYVGIVKSSDQRSFLLRIREHERDWLHKYRRHDHLFVSFGVCRYAADEPDIDQLLEDAESVLVHSQKPYENTAKTRSFSPSAAVTVRSRAKGGWPLPFDTVLGSAQISG